MRQHARAPWPMAAALFVVFFLVSFPVAAVTGGNDFYTVQVLEDPNGFGIGLYTAATGPLHPVTSGLGPRDILFGGTLGPGQSFTTIRSYTSGTDYLQNTGVLLLASAPPTLLLEGFVSPGDEAIPVGDPNDPVGFTTIYGVGSAAAAPDSLEIVQTVAAEGATFNDSAVRIETSITNTGTATVELGIRYLWDYRIGFDDGPTYQAKDPDGPVETAETSAASPAFQTYEILDNNTAASCFTGVNPTVPFFAVSGSVNGPAVLAPTPPTRLDYVAWPQISGLSGLVTPALPQASAFDYTNTGIDTSTCDITLDDSGVAYWWGDMPSNALSVPPGGTVTVSAYIFGYMPGAPPDFTPPTGVEGPPGDPTCSDTIDNDDDGLTDLDDPDCVPPGVEGPPGDPSCSDTIDNDDDGLTDLDDPDCLPPNLPPDCSAAAPSIDELWPPNHKMKTVRILGVVDPDGDPVTITVTALAQDEPLNGKGDGNTCPDAGGVGGDRVMLRSERSGQRDGRIYHIAFEGDDGLGGVCSGVVTVCVPHDKSRKKSQCVDQGPIFDASGPCAAGAADYLTRTQAFYGANPVGSDLLSMNEADSLRLHPADPLRAIYTDGTLLPLTMGSGRFTFPDLESVVGSAAKGAKDGGFLPGMGKNRVRQGARNMLANQALTLVLNSGLSLLGADSLTEMDIDGDGTKEALHFMPGFLDLTVDWSGHLGDLMSVEEVLLFADTTLANGAASAKVAEDLANFAEIPPGQPRNAKVGDLIQLLTKINAACKAPGSKCTKFLVAP